MAVTFLEPGGDADFSVATTNGFWNNFGGTPTIATDFVHGAHIKSINFGTNGFRGINSVLAQSGSRVSFYIYINALPSATASIMATTDQPVTVFTSPAIRITNAGVIQLWRDGTVAQIGSDGPTLSTGKWYRVSLAYTITNTTTNRFELFVDGVSAISVTNATITNVAVASFRIGNISANASLSIRTSDHYIDDSTSLTDTGDIWVVAKRPNANGTTNGFTTQIGAGGSGYGSGHSPQVNERPLSTTNGWSMVGVGAAITEEYNIESQSTGDFNITGGTIIDYVGWVSASSLSSETASIVVNGSSSNISLTSTNTLFKKVAGSTTYPAGTGADIGIITATTITTVSLYECGIVVAFIPAVSLVDVENVKIQGVKIIG